MNEPEVALVFTPEPWVEELHRHLTDHGGARVRQVLIDPVLALEEDYDVLVASHRWPALTRGFVDDVHARGRRVLGVYDREEPTSREHLRGLEVDAIVASDAASAEFVETLRALHEARAVASHAQGVVGVGAAATASRIVVGGPAGTGRTEVAIQLTVGLRERGRRAVLVDADEVAPAVAQRLGLLIEPNVRSAIESVEFGTGDVDSCLQRERVGGLDVLCGLPNVAGWSQVRPGELIRVLARLGGRADHLVLDASACLEDVGGGARGRFALTRALVADAAAIVGVSGGSPVGITRLLTWAADVHALAPDAAVHVVVNRAPGDRFRRGELLEEIRGSLPATVVVFVPGDRRVERAAWDGRPVSRGTFTRALAPLVDVVAATDSAAGASHGTLGSLSEAS